MKTKETVIENIKAALRYLRSKEIDPFQGADIYFYSNQTVKVVTYRNVYSYSEWFGETTTEADLLGGERLYNWSLDMAYDAYINVSNRLQVKENKILDSVK